MIEEHYQKHTIIEVDHVPEHDERVETKTFRNSKHELVKLEHTGCLICGTHDKIESHHIFERCYWNGYDIKLVAHFLFCHFDFHGHCKKDFENEDDLYKYLSTFKDDEAADCLYNQLALCAEHHRGEGKSAHGSTFATFVAWMAHKKDYEISMSLEEYEALPHKGK